MGDFSATKTGTVEEGIKHVVYVYAKNPEIKKGSVIVKYVDENGNTIAEDVEDTLTSDVDTDYDTTDHKPYIIEKDGKRYIFTKVKDGDNETGKVTEGTTTVTYVYKELGSYIPGYTPKDPGKDTPVPYEKNEDPKPEKSTTSSRKDQPTRDSENPVEPSTANNNTNTPNAEVTTLPQTGDKDENNLASLGILSLLAGVLGVFAGRKKRKKTDK